LFFTNPICIFFGVIISDCQLPKFTENTHKIAQNVQKLSAGWEGVVAVKGGGDVRIGAGESAMVVEG